MKGNPYKNRYKHGKQTEPITLEQFKTIMEKGKFVKCHRLRDRSLLAFLYWYGVRSSEALERTREDFKTEDGLLIVNAPAKKGGQREALEIRVDLPYVNLIIKQVNKTRRTTKNPFGHVWNMSQTTAWRVVKRVMPKHYPHFFRLNRATRFLDDPTTTIPQMKAWFGWKSADTINSYIGHSRRHIKEMRAKLGNELTEK